MKLAQILQPKSNSSHEEQHRDPLHQSPPHSGALLAGAGHRHGRKGAVLTLLLDRSQRMAIAIEQQAAPATLASIAAHGERFTGGGARGAGWAARMAACVVARGAVRPRCCAE